MRKPLVAAVSLSLLLAGCGGSSHKSSTATGTQTDNPVLSTSTASTKHKPSKHQGSASPHRAAAKSTGPPPAPDGLRVSGGFGTYELCSGSCSGSIPALLRRPLRTPASCSSPSTSGPVTPQPRSPLHVISFIGSAWDGGRVNWNASGYSGPVLIRGRQIGGSGAVGFGEGHVPYDELQLQTGSAGPPWQSFTRVQAPGCYFYQVDGTSFSETIVFRAQ